MPNARLGFAAAATTVMIVILSVQFLLGMGVNLTVNVAHAHFGLSSMMGIMRGKPLLMVHMMLGMLVAVLAIITAVAAGVTGRGPVLVPGLVGLAAVLVAGYGGIWFLLTGGNAASFTMATGFIIAYAAYFIEMVLLVRLRPAPGGDGAGGPQGQHADRGETFAHR
ncbi:MAG: hypothetical protein ACYDH5_01765 [Acidimicrobiales bacterium]